MLSPAERYREMMKYKFAILIFLFGLVGEASAINNVVAQVMSVEPTYLPGSVSFQISPALPLCTSFHIWSNADTSNNKAVYATLVAAMLSGKKIQAYSYENAPCNVVFLHLLN
jgi:hypothetical protein